MNRTDRPLPMPFPLSSQECFLLLLMQRSSKLSEIARIVGRDRSVISKQLKAISQSAPLLTKRGKSWQLTELGNKIAHWTQQAIKDQNQLLDNNHVIQIVSNTLFASVNLLPQFDKFTLSPPRSFSLQIDDGDCIPKLLDGSIDLAFTYGVKEVSELIFESLGEHDFVPLATESFLQKHHIKEVDDLNQAPYLQFDQQSFFSPPVRPERLAGRMNSLNGVFELCKKGVGWAFLPKPLVIEAIQKDELIEIEGWTPVYLPFGIYWKNNKRPHIQTLLGELVLRLFEKQHPREFSRSRWIRRFALSENKNSGLFLH